MTDEKRLFMAMHSKKIEEPEVTFTYIYDKYKPLLIFIASKYLKNILDIDDVVQETFIEFFNDAHNIKTSIKSYLTISCKHNCLDFLKKNKKIILVDEEQENILFKEYQEDFTFTDNLLKEIIEEMQCFLSEEEIIIILLHLIEDLKFEEVAKKLNEKNQTIKTKYYRALKKFKRKRGEI